MVQYVRRPLKYVRDSARYLSCGKVYLPESLDPDDENAPWRVIREVWVDDTPPNVCILHADDHYTDMPTELKPGDGVWVADYKRDWS